MATIDDVYALLQTVNNKVDVLTGLQNGLEYQIEAVAAMVSSMAPFVTFGDQWYVSRAYGNDISGNGTHDLPFATIGKALTMTTDDNHDAVIVLPSTTPYNELVVMNKRGVMLFGSGNDCRIDPVGAADHSVKITAANCGITGFGVIQGRNGHRAVHALNADAVVLQRSICQTDGVAEAVVVEECLVPILGPDLSCSHTGGHGLVIKSTIKACHWARIDDVTAHQCGGDGLRLEGNVDRAIIRNCLLHDNVGYGAYLGSQRSVFHDTNHVYGNTAGQVYDSTGTNYVLNTVLDTLFEGTWTPRKLFRILMAAFGGKSSGSGSGTEKYRGVLDNKYRITATLDGNNNRTGMVLDGD